MINVFLVDDSAVVRQVLTQMIDKTPGMTVSGTAQDPIFAQQNLAKAAQWPDVIVLDVEMPRMDGITYLKKLMNEHPTPVVMCSTLTEEGSRTTAKALSLGAVDVIAKPKTNLKTSLANASKELIDAIRGAAAANVAKLRKPGAALPKPLTPQAKQSADVMLAKPQGKNRNCYSGKLIAIGASTGGTQALEVVLCQLPATTPPILIVQHMPEKFTAAFAERLNKISQITVKEAESHEKIAPNTAYIAPGGKHMMMSVNSLGASLEVKDGPLVSRHRPSVDVLFRSVAKATDCAMGVIMTGMGDDGAAGLLEMKNHGARTIGQNKETCVVYGMPDIAFKKGAVDLEVPLDKIATMIVTYYAGRCS